VTTFLFPSSGRKKKKRRKKTKSGAHHVALMRARVLCLTSSPPRPGKKERKRGRGKNKLEGSVRSQVSSFKVESIMTGKKRKRETVWDVRR